jgi:hypothetical protein
MSMWRVLRAVVLTVVVVLTWAQCANQCNKQGVCNKYGRCECYDGFQGGDCSERGFLAAYNANCCPRNLVEPVCMFTGVCPYGEAWSDPATATDTAHASMECSNRGICDRSTSKCECQQGFTGNACQRLSCNLDCSSNGACLSLESYATNYRSTDTTVQYDYSTPWDKEKVFGCVCDYGFTSYDCAERKRVRAQLNSPQCARRSCVRPA